MNRIHALESRNKDDDTKWLTYWVVFANFSVIEFWSDAIFSWFPFYWLAKIVFLVWCFAPVQNNGSVFVYNRIIRRFFLSNKSRIEEATFKIAEEGSYFLLKFTSGTNSNHFLSPIVSKLTKNE